MITVIVPAYNAQDTLGDCLSALEAQSIDRDCYEIILVDDGSTDRTPQIAQQHQVAVLTQANSGPAAARNLGAAAARGELLLFTDADCAPSPDWIERMIEPFSEPSLVGTKGVYLTRQPQLVARFVQLEYETKYRRMARKMAQDGRIDFIDTYSAAYRKDVFLANGGFDAAYLGTEDQEFSFRLARKGYRLSFNPQAVVYHRHVVDLGAYWHRKFKIGYWKALLLRQHPDRVAQDSHTPQLLKVQMGLAAMMSLGAAGALVWSPAQWLALGVALLFLLSSLPFVLGVLARDPAVALASPLFLLVRAYALGVGLVAGAARFPNQVGRERAPISGATWAIKRAIDVACSVVGLILAAPVLMVLAVCIRLGSPGPAFFVQQRVGKDGRSFRMIKLRTMVDGAEDMLPEVVDRDTLDGPAFKVPDDPRVTRIGRWLRRTSLDELPQLWNVLRGEMSLVGPRPEEMRIVGLYNDWHRRRLVVKPGMTGPMQVNGRADLSLDERTRLEIDYIEHYSLWRDLCILVRTAGAILSGRGAY